MLRYFRMVPYYLANLTMTGILFVKVHHDDCHIGDVGRYTWEPLHFSQAMSENIKESKGYILIFFSDW